MRLLLGLGDLEDISTTVIVARLLKNLSLTSSRLTISS